MLSSQRRDTAKDTATNTPTATFRSCPVRGLLSIMVSEQRTAVGRAYREGELVCGRVHVTFRRDRRLGLAPRERRQVAARFVDRVHPELRAELAELARRRGAAAQRAAERFEPIVVVIDDPQHGRERIVARLEPPQVRCIFGHLSGVEFALREPSPT